MASREVSLELIELSRRFGSVVALDGLTFSVPPGEVFGFLGPNGAGKTTTMRAIFGVVALEAGQVRWRGQAVTEQARRQFGYMPEERGLYPSMQILEQLEYLGRLHDMTAATARDAARHWIKRQGLAGREPAKLEALSHGNQQRVQLAAALVAVGMVWMARTAATIYGRSILRTGSRVRLRQVLTRGEAA